MGSAPNRVTMIEHERRDWRERAGGEKRDAGLVGERREIVDTREAHDLPPLGGVHRPGVRADRLKDPALEKPAVEPLPAGACLV